MNLEYSPSPAPSGTSGGLLGGKTFTDAEVIDFVAAKVVAKTAGKEAAIAELEAACAQAERDEVMLGSGHEQTGRIRQLVLRITRLEGELEHLARATTGLGGE